MREALLSALLVMGSVAWADGSVEQNLRAEVSFDDGIRHWI
jgi:prepilin-type processing-associated H-X9-DG protein